MATGADRPVTYRCSICHAVYSAGERFCPLDAGAIGLDDGNADPRIGRTIDGRYFVKRLIGRGGMGAVYEADHVGLDKRVAIKFLSINKTDRDALARFRREAKTASRIVHEHVVQIFDVGTADSDTDFIVMEYLEGRDLAVVLREFGAFDPNRTLSIIRKVLRGLRAIHQAGIVHRDIKPANVLLASKDDDRDFVKIMDFGISKSIVGETLTQTGAIIGTPEYMSPEQLLAEDIDERSDIYAVGIMMWRMLANRLPFTGDTFDRAAAASPYVPVAPIDTIRPGLPPALVEVVAKAVAKDRNDRYRDAQAFITALEALGMASIAPVDAGPTSRQPSALEAAPTVRPPSALATADTAMAGPEITPAIARPGAARIPGPGYPEFGGKASIAPATAPGSRNAVAAAATELMPPTQAPQARRNIRWWLPVGALVLAGAAVAVVLAVRGGDGPPAKPDQAAVTPATPADAAPAKTDHRRKAREAERQGKLDDAIAAYLDAYTEEPDADVAFHLAELYERQGKAGAAVTNFQRYLHMAKNATDRDTVTARIAKLEKTDARPGASVPASRHGPERTIATVKKKGRPCHCISRDGRPDRQALCARVKPSLCKCKGPTGPDLCPMAFEKCTSEQDCANGEDGHRCPDASYKITAKPGVHDTPCTGFGSWRPTESLDGKLFCDVCANEPPRKFTGENGDECHGFYRHTGQPVVGTMHCD